MKKQMTRMAMMLVLVVGLSAGVAKAEIDGGFFVLNSYDEWVTFPLTLSLDKDYRFSSFVELDRGSNLCRDNKKVDLPTGASVTKTIITGNHGKKPSKVTLKVGSASDDTTPIGSDGSWSGSTNSFNGSSFSNGIWNMIITKPSDTGNCSDYDGTTLTFQY